MNAMKEQGTEKASEDFQNNTPNDLTKMPKQA